MTQAILNQWVTVGGIPYPEYYYEPELEPIEQEIMIQFQVTSEYEIPVPRFTYLQRVILSAAPQLIPQTITAMRLNAIKSKVTGDFKDSPYWLYGIQKNGDLKWFEEDELIDFNSTSNYYDEI
ncbi:hypothetical protein [Chroococcus sp. FPU101]|uniref:hypothetical protein n=1 Tax=Chroococcus sp. FPU101 TaxID=1974212 RepID=UPI001A8E9722|nr:hypothetical protein [Chroococcus sp. FPU101]GFE72207.1 hypothetical protein CFPU101_48170 [Chroococcus sp. FPU101]